MSKRVEVQIPFAGFYETYHDMKVDEAVESGFNWDPETSEDKELPDAFWDADINWSAIHNEYCKQYVAAFAEAFELDLEFVEMTSPREYNFTTDRIFATIPEEQMNKIKDKVLGSEEGRKYVSDRFTSRDGFSSFYSNDLDDEEWKGELDYNQLGVILQFYVEQDISEENWYEFECGLVEDFELYGWDSVIDAQAAVEKAIREAEIKDAANDIKGAMDELDNFYLGEHNMPTYAFEAFQFLKSALVKLGDKSE